MPALGRSSDGNRGLVRGYALEIDTAPSSEATDTVTADFTGWVHDLEIEVPAASSKLLLSILVNGEVVAPARSTQGGFRTIGAGRLDTKTRAWVNKGDDITLRGVNQDTGASLSARCAFTLEAATEEEIARHKSIGRPFLPWLDAPQEA